MMVPELEIEFVPTDSLVPYARNSKEHPEWQVDQIASSIEEFGFSDPIGIWHDENGLPVIVEGHGRLLAAKKLGIGRVPTICLDHLDDEGRRAYGLVQNKLNMNTGFDYEMLEVELDSITDIDMSQFDFNVLGASSDELDSDGDERYSQKITTPVYEVRGEEPDIHELYDAEAYGRLVSSIEEADIDDELRHFLIYAASRHIRFDYGKIAEFYAHQPREIQELMEDSTLVIVDFDKAVELGCVKAAVELDALREEDLSE